MKTDVLLAQYCHLLTIVLFWASETKWSITFYFQSSCNFETMIQAKPPNSVKESMHKHHTSKTIKEYTLFSNTEATFSQTIKHKRWENKHKWENINDRAEDQLRT